MLKNQFAVSAKSVVVSINGAKYLAEPKEFSTGSRGWYMNGKVTLAVGEPITVVINGQSHTSQYQPFSTGSTGYNVNGKQPFALADGSVVNVQVGMNVTAIGSKETKPVIGEQHQFQIGLNLTIQGSKEAGDNDTLTGTTAKSAARKASGKEAGAKMTDAEALRQHDVIRGTKKLAPVAQQPAPTAAPVKPAFSPLF